MKTKRNILFLVFIFSLFYFIQIFTQSKPIFIEHSKTNFLLQKNVTYLQKAIITPLDTYSTLSNNNIKNEGFNIYFNPPINIFHIINELTITPRKIINYYSYKFVGIIFRYKMRIILS